MKTKTSAKSPATLPSSEALDVMKLLRQINAAANHVGAFADGQTELVTVCGRQVKGSTFGVGARVARALEAAETAALEILTDSLTTLADVDESEAAADPTGELHSLRQLVVNLRRQVADLKAQH